MLDRMFMGAAADDKLFVEDVFSTYLYTGNGSTQTITNGIDLAGKGGMVWIKARSLSNHGSTQSTGVSGQLATGLTDATKTGNISYLSSGFSVNPGGWYSTNASGTTFASWTFREAPKFFDVVTYTGNGGDLTINHSLGVQPGCIIIKKYSASGDWLVSHRYNFGGAMLKLNTTDAAFSAGIIATATTFRVFGGAAGNSDSGATYVAYVFAHDATADGVIQCGSSVIGAGGNSTVTLGWEPQWILIKRANAAQDWYVIDNMRGFTVFGQNDEILEPNTSDAAAQTQAASPTATGFTLDGWTAGDTWIYIAIRRGPMRTPTLGTSVFAPVTRTGTGAAGTVTTGFNPDLVFDARRDSATIKPWFDKLRGATRRITSTGTDAEASDGATYDLTGWTNTGYKIGFNAADYFNQGGGSYVDYALQRAPGFFDEVCYTGTGNPLTLNHNLGVAPELIIYKARSSAYSWIVQSSAMNVVNDFLILNATSAKGTTMTWRTPTSTTFGVNMSGNVSECNYAGTTYVAYLFASAPGVSKVGSYTGNGSSQTINCGFAAGARFVMIKRTDAAEHWHVFDTARGINAGNDPALRLSSDTAEFTSAAINPESSGFTVVQSASCNNNVSGGTYIYLAIA